MTDIKIRKAGRAGRITLTRPSALNAVTYEMVLAISDALENWRNDPDVALVVIDAEGDRAFSAGGDLAQMYATGTAGDFSYGQTFWADEYRLNAKIATYPKPYVAFCQGFTMGGGVGVSLHGSHRIVGETSKIAMPECAVGLVPDVGGTHLLANAPGFLGEFLGLTGYRMDASGALYAGFADLFVPQADWPDLIQQLETTGATDCLTSSVLETSELEAMQPEIDQVFGGADATEIWEALPRSSLVAQFEKLTVASSPLSLACTVGLVRMARAAQDVRKALEYEYRFTARVMEHGDFLEGIRSVIIDKDRSPNWRYPSLQDVPVKTVEDMLAPLYEPQLTLS